MAYHRGMSKVEEIEQAIEKLSIEELAEIRAWLWDRDIERDAVAGRLDHLAEEALSEYRTGRVRRL
jgi:predicted transcriptional regulator